MPFTVNLSGTAQVDDSIILAFDQGFIVGAGQEQILDQFVDARFDIGAKSIAMPKYGRIAVSTTPLTEDEEATATALSDTSVLFTPKEYGRVVSRTALASLQTGGKVDLAAARVVGLNMGQTMDALAIAALGASTNVTVDATFDGAALDAQYSRLVAKSIATIDGAYVALLNEAQIATLRNETGFTDVAKYASAESVLRNEVGFYKGHKIVRHQGVAAGTVISLGFNALGKAVSKEAGLVITGPFDNLARFVNVGWHGVLAYGIVDTDAVEVIKPA